MNFLQTSQNVPTSPFFLSRKGEWVVQASFLSPQVPFSRGDSHHSACPQLPTRFLFRKDDQHFYP